MLFDLKRISSISSCTGHEQSHENLLLGDSAYYDSPNSISGEEQNSFWQQTNHACEKEPHVVKTGNLFSLELKKEHFLIFI